MSEQVTGTPGWHADPWFAGQRRYHDGQQWTADVFADGSNGPAGVVPRGSYGPPPSDPASPPPPPPEWGTTSSAPPPPPPAAWPDAVVAAPPAPRRRRAWLIGVAVVAVLALLIAALAALPRRSSPTSAASSAVPSPSTSQSPSSPSSPSPSSPGPRPGGTANAEQTLLGNLVVRQKDVSSDYIVGAIDGGTKVEGEVTLDLCDGTFPSESLRKQRLQVAALDRRDASYQLSTEAVLYGSDADTKQAFDEIRAVATACKPSTKADPSTGASITTTVTAGADTGWSSTDGVERLAYTVTRSSDTGTTESTTVVYLRRGPILLGLYFPNPDRPQMAVEGKTTVPDIVTLFEKRLLDPPTDPVTPVVPLPGAGGSGAAGGGGIPA